MVIIMKLEEYIHNQADKAISIKIFKDLKMALENIEFHFQLNSASNLRDNILLQLKKNGWSEKISVSPNSRITITSINNKVGLCLQTGNMSRFYADLLKLETLFVDGRIDSAIYLICVKETAKSIGSNIANFERFTEELQIFSKTITTPIYVFGLK